MKEIYGRYRERWMDRLEPMRSSFIISVSSRFPLTRFDIPLFVSDIRSKLRLNITERVLRSNKGENK